MAFLLSYLQKNVLNCNLSVSFEVECLFSMVSGDILIVETVLHHQSEAPIALSFAWKYITPHYTATTEQIELLLDRSMCRQFFSAECYNTAQYIHWHDKQSNKYTAADIDPNCDCPYIKQ